MSLILGGWESVWTLVSLAILESGCRMLGFVFSRVLASCCRWLWELVPVKMSAVVAFGRFGASALTISPPPPPPPALKIDCVYIGISFDYKCDPCDLALVHCKRL